MQGLARLLGCCRRHPGALGWPLAGALLAALGNAEPWTTRVLVGLSVSLPGLLLIAFRLGAEGVRPDPPDVPSEQEPIRSRVRAWAKRQTPGDELVDPLRNRIAALGVTVFIAVTAAVALVLSVTGGTPEELPAVALSSPAIFHLQRMLVPTFAVALLSVFLTRAAFGYFPQKVSTTSAEWPAVAAARRDVQATEVDRELADFVRGLGDDHRELVAQTRELRLGTADLELRTAELESEATVHAGDIDRLGDAAGHQSRAIVAMQRAFALAIPGGERLLQQEWERLEPGPEED